MSLLNEIASRGALPFDTGFIVRDPSKVVQAPPGSQIIRGDLGSPDFVRKAVHGYDTLLHIAGIHLSTELVRACAEAHDGPRWLILVHTSGIYSRFKSAGEYYRRVEEEISKITGSCPIDVTILRPTMIYGRAGDGTMDVFIRMVDRLRLFPVVGSGHTPIRPVRATDLGSAYLQILLHPATTRGHIYDLSGGEAIDIIDIFRTISHKIGKRTVFLPVPLWLASAGAGILRALTIGRVDMREKVLRMTEPRIYPHTQATADFGYNPTDFDNGITPQIEEYLRAKGRKV